MALSVTSAGAVEVAVVDRCCSEGRYKIRPEGARDETSKENAGY